MGRIPGIDVAVENWRLAVSAASGHHRSAPANCSPCTATCPATAAARASSPTGPSTSSGSRTCPRASRRPAMPSTPRRRTSPRSVPRRRPPRCSTGCATRHCRRWSRSSRPWTSLEGIAPVLPDALGANGVRRYLVAIGNQAEMRAAGGAPLTPGARRVQRGPHLDPDQGPDEHPAVPAAERSRVLVGPGRQPVLPRQPAHGAVRRDQHAPQHAVLRAGDGRCLDRRRLPAGRRRHHPGPHRDRRGARRRPAPVESPVYGTVDGARLGQILLIDAYQDFGQEGADRAPAGQPGTARRPARPAAVRRRPRLGRAGHRQHGAGPARADLDAQPRARSGSPWRAAPPASSTTRARATGPRCTRRTATRARSTSSSSATCSSRPRWRRTARRA